MRLYMGLVLAVGACFVSHAADATGKGRLRGKAFVAITDDFQGRKSEMHYKIKDKLTGKFKDIKFKNDKAPDWFQNDRDVDVSGDVDQDGMLVVDPALSTHTSTDTTEVLYPTDKRLTLTLLVSMNDGSPYLSSGTAASYLFGKSNSVAHYYLESTAGKITFDGDLNKDGVPDIHSVKINDEGGADCSYSTWGSLADQEAKNLGVDVTKYKHIVYVLPSNTACGWWGVANVSGPRAYLRAGGANVFAHEIGHNLGMRHAGTDSGNDGSIDSTYGDLACVMGNAVYRYLNAPHMVQMGTFSSFSKQLVDASAGSYQLSALGLSPTVATAPQIVRVKKGSTGQYYFLSYRAPIGLDSGISSTYSRGVSIHWGSLTGAGVTGFVKAIAPGESFTDSANGIVISALDKSADGLSMGVSIQAQAEPCISSQPSLTLASNKIAIRSGESAQVAWTVANKDSSSCASTVFSMRSIASVSSISANLSQSEVALTGGSSASGQLVVNSSTLDASGSVSVAVDDNDGRAPAHSPVSASVSVVVDNTAPSAVPGLSASVSNDKVSLSWGPASDSGSGIAAYEVFKNGTLIGTTSGTSLTATAAVGTHTFSVVAVDLAKNKSASVSTEATVTTTTTTKTKGGGGTKGGGSGGGRGGGKFK